MINRLLQCVQSSTWASWQRATIANILYRYRAVALSRQEGFRAQPVKEGWLLVMGPQAPPKRPFISKSAQNRAVCLLPHGLCLNSKDLTRLHSKLQFYELYILVVGVVLSLEAVNLKI